MTTAKIRAIVCGCCGRMGTALQNIITQEQHNIEIVAGIDTASVPCSYPVYSNVKDCDAVADIIVNFLPSTAEDIMQDVLSFAISKNLPLIICTTGLTAKTQVEIQAASKHIAILPSANMSLGIAMMKKLLQNMSKTLYDYNFDIEIIEKHHNKKVDAPSGTAVLLHDIIASAIGENVPAVTDRTKAHAVRHHNEIGIHAVRGGTIIGDHNVIFAGKHETIEISHSAQSRDVFIEGTIAAILFLYNKPAGAYGMDSIV